MSNEEKSKKESKTQEIIRKTIISGVAMFSTLTGAAADKPNNTFSDDKEPITTEATTPTVDNTQDNENTIYFDDAVNSVIEQRTNQNSTQGYYRIGNFDDDNFLNISQASSNNEFSDFHEALVRDTIEIDSKDKFREVMNERDGAFASASGDVYDLPEYKLSGDFYNYVKATLNTKEAKDSLDSDLLMQFEYMMNNPIAQIMIKQHEYDVHGFHESIVDKDALSPYMATVFSDMTEKVAYYAEYMALASLYGSLKEKGIENLTYTDDQGNEVNRPIDELLKYKPGLDDIIKEHGFDIKNPSFIEAVIKTSSENWDKERGESYIDQAFNHNNCASNASLIGMIQSARKWEKTQKEMLQGIQLYNGQEIPIPNKYLEYFVPSNERINTIFPEGYVSNEDLLKVDKYLDSIGVKKDEDKALYLAEQSVKINNRDSSADLKLRDLLLACNDKNNIIYSDGLVDTFKNDGTTVTTDISSGASFVSDSNKLDIATNNPSATQQLKDDLAKIQVITDTVSPTKQAELELNKDLSEIKVKTENVNTVQISMMNKFIAER